MPAALAGADIDRDQAFAEQARALAVHAQIVATRQFDAEINQTQLRIGAHVTPDAGMTRQTAFGLALGNPAVIAELALARDGVEDPETAAGAGVIAAHIADRR